MSKFGKIKNEMLEDATKMAEVINKFTVLGGGKITNGDEFSFIIAEFSDIKAVEDDMYELTLTTYIANDYVPNTKTLKWVLNGRGQMNFTDDAPVEKMMKAVFKDMKKFIDGDVEYIGLLDEEDIETFRNERQVYEDFLDTLKDEEDEEVEEEEETEEERKPTFECNIKMFN